MLIVLLTAMSVGACTTGPSRAPVIIKPPIISYTQGENNAIIQELEACPNTTTIDEYLRDYLHLRDMIRSL